MNRIAYPTLGILSLAAALTLAAAGQTPATPTPPAAQPQTMCCPMQHSTEAKSADMAGAKPAATTETRACPMMAKMAAGGQSDGMAGMDMAASTAQPQSGKTADATMPPCCCHGKK